MIKAQNQVTAPQSGQSTSLDTQNLSASSEFAFNTPASSATAIKDKLIAIIKKFSEGLCINDIKGFADVLQQFISSINCNEMSGHDMEMRCHEFVGLFVLESSIEVQTVLMDRLFAFAYQINPTSQDAFTLEQFTVWTSLLLLVNPVRLKMQCDDTTCVFQHFKALLDADKWAHRCVKATLTLSLGLAVKYARSSLSLNVEPNFNARAMVDEGVENLAIETINAFVLKVPKFYAYKFLVDVLDCTVKYFVCYFRDKVHEMFCLCEEELYSLAEGSKAVSERTSYNMHFKSLVELITTLYEPSTPQLSEYAEQFTDSKFEALREFVYGVRSVTAPALSISYLSMMRSLCKSQTSGTFIFNLLENWDVFFISLRKYLEYFRSCDQLPSMRGFPSVSVSQMISEHELAGLLSWGELATKVARADAEVRRQINEERSWNCVENIVGLLSCSIPLVLKGKLYELLAALAIDEGISIHIWNCLITEGICIQVDEKLSGIQQDLEEQECVAKVYDCSHGFLLLMKELFRHKTRPAVAQLAPYLHFIVDSILCQFMSRSYVDSQQMWELAKLALDSLYELLRLFYVTQVAVCKQISEVWLLMQLLNNTPLLVNVLSIIVEGTSELRDSFYSRNKSKDEASLSAIRLIYMAVSHQSALADAIRAIASNMMVCTVEALMFSPIPQFGKQHIKRQPINCMALLFSYINENEYFIKHTFYVVRILRNLCCQRPSIQKQIVQSAVADPTLASVMVEAVTRLTVIFGGQVNVFYTDLALLDIDGQSLNRVRGEIIRNLLESFIDSIESDPKSPNLAYMLFGFDIVNVNNTDVKIAKKNSSGTTCFYNFLEIANSLAGLNECFKTKYSALYEPTLRLLLKLSSITSISSSFALRIMRSHYNLVYKLLTSAVFRHVNAPLNNAQKLSLNMDSECAVLILRKSIQSAVLELVALEFSVLLRSNQSIDHPRKLLSALFAAEENEESILAENNDSTFATTLSPDETPDRALLWSLLEQSKVDVAEFRIPICTKFDTHKLDELFRFCVHKNSCNIEQFDIEYLHLLLNTEINSIINAEIGLIKQEARNILEFCAAHNAKNLLEGACIHLLSGCLSIINVLSIHSPLGFIEDDMNKKVLVDALFLLKNYCFCVDASVEITGMISSCMFRVVRAICAFYTPQPSDGVLDDAHTHNGVRRTLFPIIHLLLQCLALPRYSKCVRFKMDIYGSVLCVFDACYRSQRRQSMSNSLDAQASDKRAVLDKTGATNTLSISTAFDTSTKGTTKLARLMDEERGEVECWSKYFEPMAAQIVDTISADITYAPLMLKIAATACMSDIISEDIVHSKNVAYHFVYSGAMACVLDTLARVAADFRIEQRNTKTSIEKCRKQLILVKALFALFARLAASEHGWTALINGRIFQRLISEEDENNKENEKKSNDLQTKDDVQLFRKLIETMSKL